MVLWRMRHRGQTSVELILVLLLSAIGTAMVVPTLRYAMDRRAVDAAAQQVMGAHKEARLTAIAQGRTVLLRISADSLVLRALVFGDTTLVWRRAGPGSYGVTVTGPAHTFRFIGKGYSIGASNASYTLTRGSARKKVIISRLGRVRTE